MTPISWETALQGAVSGDVPERAVTVTFDDGDPSIIANALPVLGRFKMTAIAFVCPGLIDTREPFWWQVVQQATKVGIETMSRTGPLPTIQQVKQLSDGERRSLVSEIRTTLEGRIGSPFETSQLTSTQLQSWVAGGNYLGNHTWDHPLLDMCDADSQEEQISRAHDWLGERFQGVADFAYPNGNWSRHSENMLARLGYRSAALFDHKIAATGNPMSMSRIRVNAYDPLPEFVVKASGLHSYLHRRRGA